MRKDLYRTLDDAYHDKEMKLFVNNKDWHCHLVMDEHDELIGLVELSIAGLMSNERAEVVAGKAATVLQGFRACGCQLNNPNMQLSLLALVVIPELRISDLGLVDVTKFDFVPVLEG